MANESYLVRFWYITYNSTNKQEYTKSEFIFKGTDGTIDDIIKKEIDTFNKLNKKYGYKIEQYDVFKHMTSKSLKETL